MTSWANLSSVSLKKKEPTIRSYFEPISEDYATSHLGFLYSFIYSQRNAEPFYIHDTQEFFQPLLNSSPILHYIKETPASGTNLASDVKQMAPIINTMSLATLRRNIQSINQYNPLTQSKVDSYLTTVGMAKQVFDIGIVLDLSGCVPSVISSLKTFQKRTGKKTMKIFVMTDSLPLLREFAAKGDATWNYVSLMRQNNPQDKQSRLMKTLADLTIMRQQDFMVLRLSSSLGKLLYITNSRITMDSQVFNIENSSWKAIE